MSPAKILPLAAKVLALYLAIGVADFASAQGMPSSAPYADGTYQRPQPVAPVGSAFGTPVGPGQFGLAVTTSTALTVPAGATWAVITPEGAAVRWRDDGPGPTATVGYPEAIGSQLTYSASLANIRFIGQAAGATLDVLYYK